MTEKMGYETNKNRVRRVFRNKKCAETIGGIEYTFDSQLERDWAKYLQFLKEHGEIRRWEYHPCKFSFWEMGYRNKPYEYTPDFLVYENDGTKIYQETKGYMEKKDISRFRRANKHFDAIFDLVLQRRPKKGKMSQTIASATGRAYIRRIIDASEIFRQVRGLL
jgi:hypothetical protein